MTYARYYVSRVCDIIYMGQRSRRGSRTFVPSVLVTLQERYEVTTRSHFLKKIRLLNGISRRALGALMHKNKLGFMYGAALQTLDAIAFLDVPSLMDW